MGMKIPNEHGKLFETVCGRKKLIDLYANSDTMFIGQNEKGEQVYVSISERGIVIKTEQENGWLRVNWYDEEGFATGESYEGKWK